MEYSGYTRRRGNDGFLYVKINLFNIWPANYDIIDIKDMLTKTCHKFNGLQQLTDGFFNLKIGLLTSLALVLGGEGADINVNVVAITERRRAFLLADVVLVHLLVVVTHIQKLITFSKFKLLTRVKLNSLKISNSPAN